MMKKLGILVISLVLLIGVLIPLFGVLLAGAKENKRKGVLLIELPKKNCKEEAQKRLEEVYATCRGDDCNPTFLFWYNRISILCAKGRSRQL